MQVREKVGKSRNTAKHCVFQWFVAPKGRKVGSLKRRVRSHLAGWEMNNCTPLGREAHLAVKMYKAHHVQSTFGSCDVQKVHAVVARSTFRSQNAQSTSASEHFWKLRCWKSARRCGAKFGSQTVQSTTCSRHFWTLKHRFAWQAQGFSTLPKVSETWVACSISKNNGRRGTFEEDLQRSISRGRRSTRDMFTGDVRRSDRWFPEKGCILEHQIFRFAKMILRDRCNTLYDLASLFRGRRSTLDRWSGKIAKCNGTRPSALHSTFHSWRMSRRILSFLMLPTSKIEEVSQNCWYCCVFDVVKFKDWGSLAE